jgi:hypothetical protein
MEQVGFAVLAVLADIEQRQFGAVMQAGLEGSGVDLWVHGTKGA